MGMFSQRQLPLRHRSIMQQAMFAAPQICRVGAHLAIRVPTVGLHDKGAFITGKQGREFNSHADSKALRAAKAMYLTALPALPKPVAGPLKLHVEFVLDPPSTAMPFDGVLPYTGKPDRSNLLKLFEDCLRMKGWMTDDALVIAHPGGKWVSFNEKNRGVWFTLETMTPDDETLVQAIELMDELEAKRPPGPGCLVRLEGDGGEVLEHR